MKKEQLLANLINADTLSSTLANGIQQNVKSILHHASWIYPRNANFV